MGKYRRNWGNNSYGGSFQGNSQQSSTEKSVEAGVPDFGVIEHSDSEWVINTGAGDCSPEPEKHDDWDWGKPEPESPSPIFRLPAEVRNNIWDQIINEELRMERSERFARNQIDSMKLLRICFQGTVETLDFTTRSLLVGMAADKCPAMQKLSSEFMHRIIINNEIMFEDPRTMAFFFNRPFPVEFIRALRYIRIWVHSSWQWIDFFGGDLCHPMYNSAAMVMPFLTNLRELTFEFERQGPDAWHERRGAIAKKGKPDLYDPVKDAKFLWKNYRWLFHEDEPCYTAAIDWLLDAMFPFVNQVPTIKFEGAVRTPQKTRFLKLKEQAVEIAHKANITRVEFNEDMRKWLNIYDEMYIPYQKIRPYLMGHVWHWESRWFVKAEARYEECRKLLEYQAGIPFRQRRGCLYIDDTNDTIKVRRGIPPRADEYRRRNEAQNKIYYEAGSRPACECSPPCSYFVFFDDGQEEEYRKNRENQARINAIWKSDLEYDSDGHLLPGQL